MKDPDVRRAVALYLDGTLTEAEAAKRAGIPRARLREYARTCGIIASPPEDPGSSVDRKE
ncbi:MAG: hypothetical protein ACQETB_10935 [Halobacteriota archaeon]